MTADAERRPRVLVVDESAPVAEFLCHLLGSDDGGAGSPSTAHVARPRDVQAALLRDAVDVVVLSHSQAGIAATTSLVRELRSRPEPPLHAATLLALVDDPDDARFGLADAVDAVLVRPVDAAVMRRRVDVLVSAGSQ